MRSKKKFSPAVLLVLWTLERARPMTTMPSSGSVSPRSVDGQVVEASGDGRVERGENSIDTVHSWRTTTV